MNVYNGYIDRIISNPIVFNNYVKMFHESKRVIVGLAAVTSDFDREALVVLNIILRVVGNVKGLLAEQVEPVELSCSSW